MRSALRSKTVAILLCFISIAAAPLRVQERFLFRVAEQVVGLSDLRLNDTDFTALACHLPDSLILEYVGSGFRQKLHENVPRLEALKTPLREETPLVIFLSSLRQVWKLLTYIDTQEVAIAADLEKSFLRTSSCPSVAGADKKMRSSFRRWLRVEIYLRSRYAQGAVSQDQSRKEKRFQSIALFVDSLDKQVSHEDFW